MRFGIMSMQMDALVPQGLTPQNALAHIAGFDHAALVRRLADAGFNPVELGGDLTLFFPAVYASDNVARLARLKAEKGLGYTVHLPLWSVEPSSLLGPVREGSVRALVETIQATRSLEPEVYVLHATGDLAAEFYRMKLPEAARQLILMQFQAAARASIRQILSETGLPSRRLAIETIEFPFELTLALADELDLSICLDVGHILSGFSGPVDVAEALERCLPRLAEIHLHDAPWQGPEQTIRYGRDHTQLGSGDLDLPHLLRRLEAASFSGPLIFELTLEEAKASMDVVAQTH